MSLAASASMISVASCWLAVSETNIESQKQAGAEKAGAFVAVDEGMILGEAESAL